jgi:hypothetical protein
MRTIDNSHLPPVTGTAEPRDDAPAVDDAPTAVLVIGGIIALLLAAVAALVLL